MNASTPEAQAHALFQSGQLAQAEAAWRAILARKPGDAEALHLLGLVLGRTGRRDEGLALVDQSLAAAPRNAAFLNNRALLLSEAGRIEDAERDLRRALQYEPQFLAGLCHLGSLLRQQGRLDEAAAAFRRAASLDARAPEAHVGLGNVLRERGDAPGARAAYAAALAVAPRNAGAHYNLGNLLLDAQETEAAAGHFARAFEADPRHALAANNLGVALRRLGRFEEAREAFERTLVLSPRHPEALNNLGLTLQQLGRLEEAVRCYEAAVAARPGYAGALVNWGNARKDAGDLEGAAQLFDRALDLDPGAAEAMNNRANVALELGDIATARRLYQGAAERAPGFVDPRFSLAQVALFERDFAGGWDGYELRFDTSHPMATRRPIALPALGPGDLARGLRTAVWREQGVGDLVLFSTLLPELKARGTQPVVELDARLVGLYRRCLPEIEFVESEHADEAFATCQAQVALGSLPRLLRRDAASFECQPRALLAADPARVRAIREVLGPGRWIAVSWRSLQRPDRRYVERRKSMPLELLAGLAQCAGVRLLDVQYGDVDAERAGFAQRHPGALTRLADLDAWNDFEGLAAALEACEALVTVSNATAHLAGAIGKRTLLLYPGAHAPFHYWVPGPDGNSPWYPAVRIVTDPATDTWPSVVEAATSILAASPPAGEPA